MVTLEDALQDSTQLSIMVWNAITRAGFHSDARAIVLKEIADLLYLQQDNIEGIVLLEAVQRAAQ